MTVIACAKFCNISAQSSVHIKRICALGKPQKKVFFNGRAIIGLTDPPPLLMARLPLGCVKIVFSSLPFSNSGISSVFLNRRVLLNFAKFPYISVKCKFSVKIPYITNRFLRND